MAEDNTGDLWFGTQGNGVSKYDGTVFTNYPIQCGLSDNTVLGITKDKQGHLWFGTL